MIVQRRCGDLWRRHLKLAGRNTYTTTAPPTTAITNGPFSENGRSNFSTNAKTNNNNNNNDNNRKFDVVILGGGPVGCEVARLASSFGQSVALIEATREGLPLAAPTGWISKALRHGAIELGTPDGSRRVPWERIEKEYIQPTAERALAMTQEQMHLTNSTINYKDSGGYCLVGETKATTTTSTSTTSSSKDNNGSSTTAKISFLKGNAEFVGPQRIKLNCGEDVDSFVESDTVFISTGSVGTRVPGLPWNDKSADGWLYDSHTIQNIGRLPHHVLIQGGGLIGVEYAFILRRLGAKVTVILREDVLLAGKDVDDDIRLAIQGRLRKAGVDVHFGDGDIAEATPPSSPGGQGSVVLTRSGKTIKCDALASMVGRSGTAEPLDLPAGGLPLPTSSGHIAVVPTTMRVRPSSSSFVHAPRVWAVGDVAKNSAISPTGLLSTGIAQAHLAVQSAFPDEWSEFMAGGGGGGRILGNVGFDAFPPSAIWIEDGVGMVGLSENNASTAIPTGDWATVTVHFNDTLKSCVQPRPEDEMLKMVFQKSTGRILGVHIFGADAAEMIHHAGSLVNNPIENTIWHVVKSVPPAVTYAEVLMKACQRAVDVIHGDYSPISTS